MKKIKTILVSLGVLTTLCSCVTVEGDSSWTEGGIGFAPLLYTSNKEGDCTSIINGWIKSAEKHGVKIEGHKDEDVIKADNSENWKITYTEKTYEGKVGILPNQITDMALLLEQAKSIVSKHEPEFLVVPCFTSEIYKGSDLANVSPKTKIGATNIRFGDSTIGKLVKEDKCINAIGQSTSYGLPMIHLLRNQLDGANVYGDAKISCGNVRNYFYQPWATNNKEEYLEMAESSLNYKNPAITKGLLDTVVPNGSNGKTTKDFQDFLTAADYKYLKENKIADSTPVSGERFKVGVIEMSSSSNIVEPTKEFYKEYVSKQYNLDFQHYTNTGTDVIGLVNTAKQAGCDAVILNCTDTDTISAAAVACEAGMYTAVCNTQVYDYNEEILLNKDGDGKISKYFVGAYGISLSTWESSSEKMVDSMFDAISHE